MTLLHFVEDVACRVQTRDRRISIRGQILATKFTDEENRTARKSHCEPIERHRCNMHRERRSAVCRAVCRTRLSDFISVMNSFGGRPAGRAITIAQIVRDDLA